MNDGISTSNGSPIIANLFHVAEATRPSSVSVSVDAGVVETSKPHVSRHIPSGNVIDVVFPAGVPLGVELDSSLRVTMFVGSAAVRRGATSSTSRVDAHVAAGRSTTSSGTHVTVPSTSLLQGLLPAFSLAQYSGLVVLNDMLVAVDGVPVWYLDLSDVRHVLNRAPLQLAQRVYTFLRPSPGVPETETRPTGTRTDGSAAYSAFVRRVAASAIRTPGVLNVEGSAHRSVKHEREPTHERLVNVSVPVSWHEPLGIVLALAIPKGELWPDDAHNAILHGPLPVLSVDPYEAERLGSIESSADLYSAQYASSVLLRRNGHLAGLVWPGDLLASVNGHAVEGMRVTTLLEELGVHKKLVKDVIHAAALNGYLHLSSSLYMPPALSSVQHEEADVPEDTSVPSPVARISFHRGGDVICVVDGRYCRLAANPLEDAQLVHTVEQALRVSQAYTVGPGLRHSKRRLQLQFMKATAVPDELLTVSRFGATALAMYRRSQEEVSGGRPPGSSRPPHVGRTSSAAVGSLEGGESGTASKVQLTCAQRQGKTKCSFRTSEPVSLLPGYISADISAVGTSSTDPGRASLPAPTATSTHQQKSMASKVGKRVNVSRAETFFAAVPALFGGSFVCGDASLVLAVPGDACSSLLTSTTGAAPNTRADTSGASTDLGGGLPFTYRGAYVVVDRGSCSFPRKALNVQAAGGAGVLVANTGFDAPFAMPGAEPGQSASDGDGAKVAIAAAMIDRSAGEALKQWVRDARARGQAPLLWPDTVSGDCAAHLSGGGHDQHEGKQSNGRDNAAAVEDSGFPDPFAVAAVLRRAQRDHGAAKEEDVGSSQEGRAVHGQADAADSLVITEADVASVYEQALHRDDIG